MPRKRTASEHTHIPSSDISDDKVAAIIQSQIFASIPGFASCTAKELPNGVEWVKRNCPADKLERIVTTYDSIQKQVNETAKELSAWFLPQRFKRKGLWSKFGESDFNLMSALIDKHSEIIGGHRVLSMLFINKISSCSKHIRMLMSKHRQSYNAVIHTCYQVSKHGLKDDNTFHNLMRMVQVKQTFANIAAVKLHFSHKYSCNDIVNLSNVLRTITMNSHVYELRIYLDSFSEKQLQKLSNCINLFSDSFRGLSRLRFLGINGIGGPILERMLSAGLRFPPRLLLDWKTMKDAGSALSRIHAGVGSVAVKGNLSWSLLRQTMPSFSNMIHLTLCNHCWDHKSETNNMASSWEAHRTGFVSMMSVVPKLQSLTIDRQLFHLLNEHIKSENRGVTGLDHDEVVTRKLSDIFVLGIRKCKHLENLTFLIQKIFGFYYSKDDSITLNRIIPLIQEALPGVQVQQKYY